ncbi:neural cell adhesion molecule 1-like isoform X2 [Argopecten irradians]
MQRMLLQKWCLAFLLVNVIRGHVTPMPIDHNQVTDVRLSDRTSLLTGKVQVYCRNAWHTLCDTVGLKPFDDNNVCEQYHEFLYKNFENNKYGLGEGSNADVCVKPSLESCMEVEELYSSKPMVLTCEGKPPQDPVILIYGQFPESQSTVPEMYEGDIMHMRCEVTGGIPKPTITWSYPVTTGVSVNETFGRKQEMEGWVVIFYQTINIILRSDHNQAKFTCTVSLRDDRMETHVYLQVKFLPTITVPVSVTVQESTMTIIRCTVRSNPESNTELLGPDGNVIPISDQHQDATDQDMTFYDFTIGPVTPSDWGKTYTCRATYHQRGVHGSRSSRTTLYVQYAPVITLQTNYVVTDFSDVTMDCVVKSFPHSTINWTNENGVLLPYETVMTPSAAGHSTITARLHFSQVRPKLSGNYVCTAHNIINQLQIMKSATTNLHVK